MKKAILIVAMALSLTACGRIDRWWAGMTGAASKECIDGVQYLQFTSGASVQYNQNGTVKTCR